MLNSQVLQRKATFESAEAFLANKPELLVTRVILHMRQLFGIKSMAGIFPRLNEIYMCVRAVGWACLCLGE